MLKYFFYLRYNALLLIITAGLRWGIRLTNYPAISCLTMNSDLLKPASLIQGLSLNKLSIASFLLLPFALPKTWQLSTSTSSFGAIVCPSVVYIMYSFIIKILPNRIINLCHSLIHTRNAVIVEEFHTLFNLTEQRNMKFVFEFFLATFVGNDEEFRIEILQFIELT